MENKTPTGMCLQKQVFKILFLKCSTVHFGCKMWCFVDYCQQHCSESCVRCNQAGSSLTLNKTYLFQIPWLWLLFQQHVALSIILTRQTVETNKMAQKQSGQINLEIQKIPHQLLKRGIFCIQFQLNLTYEKQLIPYFHSEQSKTCLSIKFVYKSWDFKSFKKSFSSTFLKLNEMFSLKHYVWTSLLTKSNLVISTV